MTCGYVYRELTSFFLCYLSNFKYVFQSFSRTDTVSERATCRERERETMFICNFPSQAERREKFTKLNEIEN